MGPRDPAQRHTGGDRDRRKPTEIAGSRIECGVDRTGSESVTLINGVPKTPPEVRNRRRRMASTSTATGLQLRSMRSLAGITAAEPEPDEVIVRIDTSPVNPNKGLR